MQVIEAQRASILEPHDHLHISQLSAFRLLLPARLPAGPGRSRVFAAMCGGSPDRRASVVKKRLLFAEAVC